MSRHPLDFLADGGEMGAILRAHDWSSTPLGPPSEWPQALRTAVRLMLNTRHPIYIFWGEQGACLYNDPYRDSIGPERHPSSIGRPAFEVWAEIWDIIGPQIAQVMAGRGATWHENHLVPITRFGSREDVYWTYSYSPIDDESAATGVGGVMVICSETTQSVLAGRRYRFLAALGDVIRGMASAEDVLAHTSRLLGMHLDVSCVGYADVEPGGEYAVVDRDWTADGCRSVAGRHRLADYGEALAAELHAGRTVRIADTRSSPLTPMDATGTAFGKIGMRALIDVPIIKNGKLVALLFVLGAVPRDWTDSDAALVEDVAERTWEAVERSRAEAALRQADRRKDEFLAMLAHELRNPLAPITAAAELLQLGPPDPARSAHASDIILRQARHMTSLVDDLLDVSRVTRGQVKMQRMPVDMVSVIKDAVEQVQPLIRARGHRLTLQIPEERAMVRGDANRLVQSVANLLANAAKYTPDGGDISVTAETRDRQIILRVQDNGVGMSADLQARAFDLFAQAERSPDRSSGGLGLGLALVKSLVELHGGSVSCRSEGPGKGSTFTVCLPHFVDEDMPEPAPRAGTVPARRPLRILVVDDNADAASMLSMILEMSAHRVAVAHDSRGALERAQRERPDVCLLDIGLPDTDGIELAKHLRADPATSHAVLIALTGYGREPDRRKSTEAGFDHHLVKPVDIGRLNALLAGIEAR